MCQQSGYIRFYCEKLIASKTNRIVMHRLRVSCSNAPLCLELLSGQIRSYCIKLIFSRTNRIVMPLRRCVITCCLDKSDRIGIETCYCMCFTAPLCHHRIFSEQLFQLRFTGVLHQNFAANLFFFCAQN